jgi:hypothetical protein
MNKIAIIGCAPNWQEDINNLLLLTSKFDVMAIGIDCPYEKEIQYFATYHVLDIGPYKLKRQRLGLNLDFKIVSYVENIKEKNIFIDFIFEYESPSGSSAMLGTLAAIEFGYDKIILCGCPLEGINSNKISYKIFQKGWIKNQDKVKDKVKSMSGWTASFLGMPNKEWLNL